MRVGLYYHYSELDKIHEYQIVVEKDAYSELWTQWLWFYLGALFKKSHYKRMHIIPYLMGCDKNDTLKFYQYPLDAETTATWIYKRIMSHYKKH